MNRERVKVYTYKRVSTTMQIDGYSLDAQKSRIKAFADYNDYEIVREYEDAGKSGKSIEGRIQFNQMMDDIKSGKDGVSFVLVFKLSRFGRNAADVLSTLQVMQDFGVNLICVEDGIDSSKDAGKLMISVLSAVAEIERENIRVQTMEGRIQKAREGKWNGGFAPYGYQLIDGELQINEEEAAAIRVIYDQYVNTDIGSNGIAKYLENHGIRKIQRQNGKNPLFDAHLIRLILKNPVYCGKIAYGRRRTEKVHGTRNDYHLVEQDDYLLVDGLHEAIISEETWQAAQIKLLAQAKKYEHVNKGKDTRTHLLSGIVKCPICGAGMYGNKCIKHKKDGTKYKDFYYYGCKHRTMTRGHKCAYKKQIREELLDDAVAEVIVALVSKPKFASMMQEKINMKVDTSVLDQEIANHEKQLRQFYSIKSKLMEEIDSLDPDDRHYLKRKADLDDRLYRMYDKIEDEESQMIEARAKRQAIEAEKLTGDNIYKVLMYFDKLYSAMNDVERRRVMETLISEIQIYEDRQPNGQWLKSIKFKLPIIEEDMEISLDNDTHVELVEVDNQSSTDKAVTAAQELVSKKVSIVLGSYGSGVSIAAAPTFQSASIPAIGCSCTNPAVTEANPYYFRVCFLDPFQGSVMANFAKDEFSAANAYVLSMLGEDYGSGLATYFVNAFEDLGGTVTSEQFPEGTSDFSAYIQNAINAGADVIFAPCATTYAAQIITQAASAGFDKPITAGDTWESSVILDAQKGTSVQVYCSTFFDENDDSGAAKEFVTGFKEWLNADSQKLTNNGGNDIVAAVSALGYDGYMVALEAIKAAGSTDGTAIRDALYGVNYDGVTGNITFDQTTGDANKDMAYIKKAADGAFEFVKTQSVEG